MTARKATTIVQRDLLVPIRKNWPQLGAIAYVIFTLGQLSERMDQIERVNDLILMKMMGTEHSAVDSTPAAVYESGMSESRARDAQYWGPWSVEASHEVDGVFGVGGPGGWFEVGGRSTAVDWCVRLNKSFNFGYHQGLGDAQLLPNPRVNPRPRKRKA